MNQNAKTILWTAGLVIGVYDGIAGPGGGTMMFLMLLVVARLPLLQAMATTKVANLATASIALGSYAYTGHVLWTKGLCTCRSCRSRDNIDRSLGLKLTIRPCGLRSSLWQNGSMSTLVIKATRPQALLFQILAQASRGRAVFAWRRPRRLLTGHTASKRERFDQQVVSEFRAKLRLAEDLIGKLGYSLREINFK